MGKLFVRLGAWAILGSVALAFSPSFLGMGMTGRWLGSPRAAQAQGLFDEEVNVPPCEILPECELSDQNGPVLVKVVSFSGKNSKSLAAAVAKELREKYKIDSYVYRFQVDTPEGPSREYLDEYRRQYREKYKVNPPIRVLRTEPPENWVVLAGDFKSFEDFWASRLLKKIRNLKVDSIPPQIARNMVFGRQDGSFQSPLHKAMLVRNPLVPREQHPPIDKATAQMLISLNDHQKRSVYRLNAPYTMQVCEFRGMQVYDEKKADELFNPIGKKSSLQVAGENAEMITQRLCDMGYDAYVFHGKFSSIVTIGGYSALGDPRMKGDFERLQKVKLGQLALDPKPILTPRRPTQYAN